MVNTPADFEAIYNAFQAPLARKLDCGKKCAPYNQGIPVCCDHERAVPLVDKGEWDLLRGRTDLWRIYKPVTKHDIKEFGDLAPGCKAILCKGAKFCERDNRTIACRAFPFFPYFTPDKKLFGLSYYWNFEGLCWVISNLTVVERPFIDQMVAACETIFEKDDDERDVYLTFSATMRGVFTKWNRKIPILGRDGKTYWGLPGTGGRIVPAPRAAFEKKLAKFPHGF
ncbi:MAG: hypothetical protein SFV21_21695 [Rhodospirillaceae bacterium]|nr:hypothetical protein [Rhodospirillaceae bacterium]